MSPGNAAVRLASIGFHVFPAPPGQRKSYKAAAFSGGRRWGATDSPMEIAQDWKQWPDANVGIACGPVSGLLVIDIDGPSHGVDGFASWGAIINEHGDTPETVEVDTPSGGRHLYFRWTPDCEGIINSASMIGPGIDVRAEGGMVIAPPSVKPSGGRYSWRASPEVGLADPPSWLIGLCKRKKDTSPPATFRPLPPASGGDAWARRALDAEATAVLTAAEGERNSKLNTSAFNLGQIVAGGALDRGAVEATLERAALGAGLPLKEVKATIASGLAAGERQPRSPKAKDDETQIIDIAELMAQGSARAAPVYDEEKLCVASAASPLRKFLARGGGEKRSVAAPSPTSPREYAEAFPSEDLPFPIQDYERDLTGTLRDMTIWIDAAANMRSEQGAFGAALALLGTILGRKVELAETGLRTNIYIVGTADSGAGKSSAMNAMQKLTAMLGVDDRLAGSDFTSDAAILKEMGSGSVPRLFSIDEIGDVMRRVLNPYAAPHERGIGRVMKDLFSSASGIYRGKSYANQERVDITQPHMCLYGVSTHEAFWDGIDGRAFSDGLLARFVFIPIGATAAQTPRDERLDEVCEGVRTICNHRPSSGNLSDFAIQPARIGKPLFARYMEDRALFHRHSLRAAQTKSPGAPSIIMRLCENAMKIALIAAASRSIEDLEITTADYDLGMAVAHWSAISMINAIGRYYVENSSHRNLKRVLDYIEGGGLSGRTKTQIARAMQGIFVNRSEGDNILKTLCDSEQVVRGIIKHEGRGRPSEVYVAAAYAPEPEPESEG